MNYFVLTNNPLVQERTAKHVDVRFHSCGIKQILEDAALLVAEGHTLLTHPLSGSVKPGETPYKSMLISTEIQHEVDRDSAKLVAAALDACTKFADRMHQHSPEILADLQTVDCALIEGAMESAAR